MVRIISLVWMLLLACQSTARPDRPRNMPDKSPGPQFEEETKDPNTGEANTNTGTVVPPKPQIPPTEVIEGEEIAISDELPEGNPNLPFGLPKMTGGESSWVIARDQYVISWNPLTRNPNWVAWKLKASDLGTIGRSDNFTIDPTLSAHISKTNAKTRAITSKDYTGSCFDRGHLVASSDRQSSVEANKATFHMTNILPQTAFLNQRIWKGLEDQSKKWIEDGTHPNLWIISGPVYEKTLHFIGDEKVVAIPAASFKMIYSWDEYGSDKPYLVKSILVPNMNSQGKIAYEDMDRTCAEAKSGGQVKGEPALKSTNFEDYKATVQAIEDAAHIQMPDAARL